MSGLKDIRETAEFDVVIIGAGINGAGLFRELALQDLRVLLVDRSDICSGASCAPSRLIHGGIKYLETGEFRLVAQSTLERNLLLRNAPHVVKPLPTVLPIRSWFGGIVPSVRKFLRLGGKMTDRGALVLEAGLQIYDFLGRRARVMPRHSLFLNRRTREEWPHMATDVLATAQYYDAAITQPERLGYECVQDGLNVGTGCGVATYSVPVSFADGILHLRDSITGETRNVRTRALVNAGGAWIDRINAVLGETTRYIGGTKGSHLLLRHDGLLRELKGRMMYFGTPDGRICLAYPFYGHVLVGSTDIRIEDPDTAICTDDEQEYMLRMVADLFPGFSFSSDDVVYRYSGVRPLPATDASDPGAISRDHIVHENRLEDTPLLSLVGGKWTTFRGLAEEVADRLLETLGAARHLSTKAFPIGGGRDYPAPERYSAYLDEFFVTYGMPRQRAGILLERYGSRARAFAVFCQKEADAPLRTLPTYTRRELAFIASEELVRTLSDVLFRRTPVALSGLLTPDVVLEVGGVVGAALGWSAQETDRQCRAAWKEAQERHNLKGDLPDTFPSQTALRA
ncbi:glycerol-3-phosphate dehydrogenase/oxidase [Gluconobacter kondonii]|uniref:glycerol-3-phosphate dehydrogenase/oxidase n=1 Tax=Gluconobacter kondonii TaxID=941463 RepID=UPI001B8B54E2|nr:glycerol-3-phosphate dehydrogenase/oxidase [Gluconobacter kondonii]MBS1078024.1 glycerol-3-phosphate dehydrogenase/oxidase [Gluconobacter kondonii]